MTVNVRWMQNKQKARNIFRLMKNLAQRNEKFNSGKCQHRQQKQQQGMGGAGAP